MVNSKTNKNVCKCVVLLGNWEYNTEQGMFLDFFLENIIIYEKFKKNSVYCKELSESWW